MNKNKLLIYLSLSVLIWCTNSLQASQEENGIKNLRISPKRIEVGAFFKGSQVLVNAEIPDCDGVMVKLSENDKEIELNMKGKKVFFWMNVAKVIVKNAPGIYILSASDKLDVLCTNKEMKKELLGYNALEEEIIFESSEPLTGLEFEEFIKFKEHDGSYNIDAAASINIMSNGNRFLKANLNIPSFIPPGDYNVEIYCFKNKNLIDKSVIALSVEEVDLPLLITDLAHKSPAFYGIIAIILAMAAGVIIGLVFTRKKDGGH